MNLPARETLVLPCPQRQRATRRMIAVLGPSATYRPMQPQRSHEGPLAYEPQWTEPTMVRSMTSNLFRAGTGVHAGAEFEIENPPRGRQMNACADDCSASSPAAANLLQRRFRPGSNQGRRVTPE